MRTQCLRSPLPAWPCALSWSPALPSSHDHVLHTRSLALCLGSDGLMRAWPSSVVLREIEARPKVLYRAVQHGSAPGAVPQADSHSGQASGHTHITRLGLQAPSPPATCELGDARLQTASLSVLEPEPERKTKLLRKHRDGHCLQQETKALSRVSNLHSGLPKAL